MRFFGHTSRVAQQARHGASSLGLERCIVLATRYSAPIHLCVGLKKSWAGGSDQNERCGSHAAAGALPGCPGGPSQQQHPCDRAPAAACGAARRG